MNPPEIFSRSIRRRYRERAARSLIEDRWIIQYMSDEMIERLSIVRESFTRALVIGCISDAMQVELRHQGMTVFMADPGHISRTAGHGVQCDEDRLPFADASFDLVVSIGTLDSVNDVPGALTLIRRALRPGGLFIGAMLGAGTLETLKALFSVSRDDACYVLRHHPQIDVRAAGDLLARAGFDLPVADCVQVTARYADLTRLITDLRANGFGNALVDRYPLQRDAVANWIVGFAPSDGDKTEERFSLVFLTGWAPSSD
jgi:SAM-dependent methyltransferase